MAKIFFAALAVVCVFQALTTARALSISESDIAELKYQPLLREKTSRFNTSAIIDQVEKLLESVRSKADDVINKFENVVKNATDKIEKEAMAQVNRWESSVNKWVQKANETGVDATECLKENNATQFSDMGKIIAFDAKQCLKNETIKAYTAVQEVFHLITDAEQLFNDTMGVVKKCASAGIIQSAVCLTANTPRLVVRVTALSIDSATKTAFAVTRVGAVPAMTTLCMSQAVAERSLEASRVVDATIACIREKMNENES